MIIGVDLGTTGVRVALMDDSLRNVHIHKERISLEVTKGHERTCSLQQVEDAVFNGIRHVVADQDTSRKISAISFASQGEVFFTITPDGRGPERFAVTMDNTGLPSYEQWVDENGTDAFYEVTSQPCHPMYPIFRFHVSHAGDDSSTRLVSLDGYIRVLLGGTYCVDTSIACRSGLVDANTGTWFDDLLRWAHMRADLPRIVNPGSLAGTVNEEGARRSGLPKGTPIVVGSHDQASNFWGLGGIPVTRPAFSAGSSECLTRATISRPRIDGIQLPSYPVGHGYWLTLLGTPSGGWSLDWLAAFSHESDVGALIDAGCALDYTEVITHPYLAGGPALRQMPTATGTIQGLSLATGPADVARSMIEASGFEVFDAIMRTQEAFGIPHMIATAGTGAKGPASQVRADASGFAFDVCDVDATLRGAGLQAKVALGWMHTLIPSPEPKSALLQPVTDPRLIEKRTRYLDDAIHHH